MIKKNSDENSSPDLLCRKNIKSYILVLGGLIGIIVLFNIFSIIFRFHLGPSGLNGCDPNRDTPNRSVPRAQFCIWPLWGYFALPTIKGITISVIVFLIFFLSIRYIYKNSINHNLILITLCGLFLIIGTNLIHGWQMGIAGAICGRGEQGIELYHDAIKINNIFAFIKDYENIQPNLHVHARTHPPGAIIVIYLLYLIFRLPGLIAIALCVINTLTSVYFLNGIFKRFFEERLSKYMTFLYLLLPAIQVYYLANIYGIVASLVLGVIYFYLHPNQKRSITGSIICFFLTSFITFMFVFIVLCLFLFELLNTRRQNIFKGKYIKENGIIECVKSSIKNMQKLFVISIGLILIHGLIFFIFRFNYINSFLYASASENPDGFSLLTNPVKYFVTRIQDILDILIFFGPVLIVLCYRGFKNLKEETLIKEKYSQIYLLVISAIIALLIICLTGAYDHGETARAAIYIYPFLLMPIAIYLEKENLSQLDKTKLLKLIFGQTLIMQLFGFYIW